MSAAGAAPRRVLAAATVVSAVAPLHAEPGIASAQISQRLAGAALEVLDQERDWLLVRGADGYEGWVHQGFVVIERRQRTEAEMRLSIGCVTLDGDGMRRAMPLGALLSPVERVESGEAIAVTERPARFPTSAQAIVASARKLFTGTSYQWGGITPWGADCSGFVQSIFGLHGVALPRDAWQQGRTGQPAGTDALALRAGDLLFFSDRNDLRITHVGIALGERQMAHCALGRGGFAVERLGDRNDPYVVKLLERFLFARRVLQPS